MLVDAGYYSLKNIKAVKDMGVVPVIVVTPCRKGKRGKVSISEFFGGMCYLVE